MKFFGARGGRLGGAGGAANGGDVGDARKVRNLVDMGRHGRLLWPLIRRAPARYSRNDRAQTRHVTGSPDGEKSVEPVNIMPVARDRPRPERSGRGLQQWGARYRLHISTG